MNEKGNYVDKRQNKPKSNGFIFGDFKTILSIIQLSCRCNTQTHTQIRSQVRANETPVVFFSR